MTSERVVRTRDLLTHDRVVGGSLSPGEADRTARLAQEVDAETGHLLVSPSLVSSL